MPLLVSSDAQNSATSSKSLKDFFDTRTLAPLALLLSAWMAPPSALQLPPPVMSQFSMPASPSISAIQPFAGEECAQPITPRATTSMPMTLAKFRFIALPPVDDQPTPNESPSA